MESLVYFLLFAGLIFLMMRFGCGAHVMGHGHGHGGSSAERAESGHRARLVPPAKDIDPVCGMTVETVRARSSVFDGRIYYFCSASCREKFETNPTAFAKPTDTASQQKEPAHGTHL